MVSESACFFVGSVVRGEVVFAIQQLIRLRGQGGWFSAWTLGVAIRHCWRCLCGLLWKKERERLARRDGLIYIDRDL